VRFQPDVRNEQDLDFPSRDFEMRLIASRGG
jgi:hypothetical protein